MDTSYNIVTLKNRTNSSGQEIWSALIEFDNKYIMYSCHSSKSDDGHYLSVICFYVPRVLVESLLEDVNQSWSCFFISHNLDSQRHWFFDKTPQDMVNYYSDGIAALYEEKFEILSKIKEIENRF